MKSILKSKRYWHESNQPLAMGCSCCPWLPMCGGLRVRASVFDCLSFCDCPEPERCEFVCQRHAVNFVARLREVRGLDLENIARAQTVAVPFLPNVVPQIYHGSKRRLPLRTPAVAVALSSLFHRKTGEPRYLTRSALAKAFQFDENALLVVVGVDQDQPIERYWAVARDAGFIENLARLEPALVTTPNFSLLADVPRFDNLHAMKRIATSWHEIVSRGIPTALHVNARTDRDWERWRAFVKARDEVQAVGFEFQTAGAVRKRGEWYTRQLRDLAQQAGHGLTLVLRGGRAFAAELRRSFERVISIDTTPFHKTIRRRQLAWSEGTSPEWLPTELPEDESLDRLLDHNVRRYVQMLDSHNGKVM